MTSRASSLGIALRPPTEDDLDAVMAIHADPRTNTHNPAGPLEDLEEARRVLARWLDDWRTQGIGYWALEDRADRRVVGFAGVRTIRAGDLDLFNLYYRLAPEAWGRGIAGTVARKAVVRAHDGWPGRPIIARMQPGHAASMRTALRAGLQEVGRDQWGRIVMADRALPAELIAALPLGGRAADLQP
jgi:[ribosomal protein S5]-alanine N-acetyltransferase